MTIPIRKPDQAVEFDGVVLPRGSQEGRSCDLTDCPDEATALVSAPDGSILSVCSGHEVDLTAPVEPEPRHRR